MRRTPSLLCLALSTLALTACGSTVSTTAFKGQAHEVAQTISNLQADATAGEPKKICANDLATPIITRLGGTKHCETAIKNQLAEINNLEVNIQTIHLSPEDTNATAAVTSIHEGKTHPSTITLIKEHGKWKLSRT
jgi:hypothetical protein